MVKALCGFLMWLALVGVVHAGLDVKLDKTQSQLGEALLLQIKSPVDLIELDLSPITQNFDIASQTLNRATTNGREEFLLEATLYPLRSGKLTVPKLTHGAAQSRQFTVRVLPATVSMRAWFPAHIPMEREPTVLRLEIHDDGNLSWNTPIQIVVPYATVRDLPETTSEEVLNGVKRVVHRFGWQILPLREGSMTVSFGLLDAHRYAQRLRFPMSPVSFTVRAAPAYLPLYIPIGKPAVRVDPRPDQIYAGKPGTWNMYLHAPGLSAEGINHLLQYSLPDGLRMYSPSITPMQIEGEQYLRIALSFIADSRAKQFPALGVPYFDQRLQRIETLTVPSFAFNVRDLARERQLYFGLTGATAALLTGLAWFTARQWRRRQVKHRWLAQIQAAQTPAMLYATLTKNSPWQVHSAKSLPNQLHIDPVLYQDLDRVLFAAPRTASSFTLHKEKWQQLVTTSALHIYPNKSYIAVPNKLT